MAEITIVVTDRAGAISEMRCEARGTLMEALKAQGFALQGMCGGAMACATCHIYCGSDWMAKLGPRHEYETMLVEDTHAFDDAASRLSCQIELTPALNGMAIVLAPED